MSERHNQNCESVIGVPFAGSNTHPSGGGGDGRRDETQPRPVREFNPPPRTRSTSDLACSAEEIERLKMGVLNMRLAHGALVQLINEWFAGDVPERIRSDHRWPRGTRS